MAKHRQAGPERDWGSIIGNCLWVLLFAAIAGVIFYFMFGPGAAKAEPEVLTEPTISTSPIPEPTTTVSLNPKLPIDQFMCEAFQLGVNHAIGYSALNAVELQGVDLPCPDLEAYGSLEGGNDAHLFCLAHIAGFISVIYQINGELPPEGWVERQVPLCIENVWNRHILNGGFRLEQQLLPGGAGTPKSR